MLYTRSNFDDLFNTFFYQNSYLTDNDNLSEKYEINQTKDGGYLFFEVPGFNKKNLNVEVEDNVLHVHGTRTYKLNGEDIEKNINKKFKIGKGHDISTIEATVEDGILTVFIPNYRMVKKDKKKISLI